jgi:hypothetical protein
MISWRNVKENTARIDRTALNVAICRTFLRLVLFGVIDCQGMLPTAMINTARGSTA